MAVKDHLISKLKKENEQLRRVVNSYRKKAQDFKPQAKSGTMTPQRSEQDQSSRQNLHHAKVCDIDRLSRLIIFAKEIAQSDRIRKRYDKLVEHLFVSLTELVPFESVCVFSFSTDLVNFAKMPEGVQHFKTVLEGKWLDMFVPSEQNMSEPVFKSRQDCLQPKRGQHWMIFPLRDFDGEIHSIIQIQNKKA